MIARLFLVFLFIQSTYGKKHTTINNSSHPWLTLSGQRPVVIARGGYSGVFLESSDMANSMAVSMSLDDVIIYCSLQMSKDGQGYCLSNLNLANTTNIANILPDAQKSYVVDGQPMQGYFAVDYTADQLYNVSLLQSEFSRPDVFDSMCIPISPVEEVAKSKPPGFWLNVPYSSFYAQHKLDTALYVQDILKTTAINYVSSPEIGFLKSLNGKVKTTQLIFMFNEATAVEPTTNQTYASLLEDLASIKLFASGILVPKEYIFPINDQLYLEPPTTLVLDAHKQGLKVFAYSFANDYVASYNYSYDPTAEYLQFIDNSQFAVDGFLTDFPSTASEAIECLAYNKNASRLVKGKPLVISHNGASGVYPGSTDLAYQQAVDDGADVIDCSVQMSKDGVAFCSDSADLASATTAMATFLSRAATIPEIQSAKGIFSFDLSWSEIQTLQRKLLKTSSNLVPNIKSLIASPFSNGPDMLRNPANKSKGKLVTLADFLEFSQQEKVLGILISIKNAAYLASNKGLSVTDAVATALTNASFDKQSTQKVLIQSEDSAVLSKFSNVLSYEKVLLIEEEVSDIPKAAVDELKKFAGAVNLRRASIIQVPNFFTSASTGIAEKMHEANISVYVSVFRNEFVSIPFDYFSDPILELATYILAPFGVDGVVTDYPSTATAYLRSPCSNPDPNVQLDYPIYPVQPGAMIKSLSGVGGSLGLPPAAAPAPTLTVADVVDPPLPPVSNSSSTTNVSASTTPNAAPAADAPPPSKNSETSNVANMGVNLIALLVVSLLSVVC
ncbi:hypothetical protein Vadar_002629 [Vaccinium darrowii]|uniref:Uncharacterized protein n=1 Tax=Vaccinium darrowii TaxID=229202 RepID=A0ACB7Z1K9_9ERIC|nr:hypothetical protein Vadar_002629 [Vaccinium darrowii]